MTTSATTKPRSIKGSVEEVGRWGSGEQARLTSAIDEIDREITGIRAAMANLEERLAAQTASRADLARQAAGVATTVAARTYQAVFASLAEQASTLSDRAGLVAAADYQRMTSVEASLRATSGTVLEDYRQFKNTVEPTLDALPESYRKVLQAHHEELTGRIRGMVDAAMSSFEPLHAEPIALDVVWAIDSPDGTPDLLVLVVPADEAVATAWADRGDDTELWLAARVLQGIGEALVAAGLPAARPALGGHLGLLAIEVDLSGAKRDFAAVLQTHLSRALDGAPELTDARLRAVAQQVEMDWLLPPETEGGEA